MSNMRKLHESLEQKLSWYRKWHQNPTSNVVHFAFLFLFVVMMVGIITTFSGSRAAGNTYYMSPTGSDSNPGTISAPFKTLTKGWSVLNPGDTLYVRGGTYPMTATNYLAGKSGTSTSMINVFNYNGEKPVFDYSSAAQSNTIVGILLENDSYVHIKGLHVTNLPQTSGSYYNYGGALWTHVNNSIVENCEFDHIGGDGFTIGDNNNNNLILNNDTHDNADPLSPSPYNGSNGFSMTAQTTGGNNTFRGNRTWWNSDDGFDGFGTTVPIIYDGNWSFWNGYIPGTFNRPAGYSGNGVGFKLGPGGTSSTTQNLRTYTNNVSFENFLNGFDQNFASDNDTFQSTLYNNTAFGNGRLPDGTIVNPSSVGFNFGNHTEINTLKNNLSYKNGDGSNGAQAFVNTQSTQSNNSWQLLSSGNKTTLTDADFASVSSAGANGPRQADGSLPVLSFMKPVQASEFINIGVNIGLPYAGSAPDLGAYEYNSNTPLPDTTAPAVSITSPQSGSTVSGTIPISANATDDTGVDHVDFYQGSTLISGDSSSPYSVTLDTTTLANGSYTLSARAYDAAGNSGTSNSMTVTVNNAIVPPPDTTPPSVSLTAPSGGSTLNGLVTISANATDDTGVSQVSFYQGSTLIDTDTTGSPYSITWDTTGLANGTYTLTARATDAAGNTGTSSSVSVNVNNVVAQPVTYPGTAINTSQASSDSGYSYIITLNAGTADSLSNLTASTLQLYENGAALGPAHAAHADIRTYGAGRYSYWSDGTSSALYFSSSDNTDPRTNGRTYSYVASSSTSSGSNGSSGTTVTPPPPAPAAISVGSKVATTAKVTVRYSATNYSWRTGTQKSGATGTVTAGPTTASGYTWWKVNFTSGADGWVQENYLKPQ